MFKTPLSLRLAIGLSILAALLFGTYYLYNELRVRTVVIATNEEGSQSYIMMKALADSVERNNPHIKVQIIQTAGSTEIMDKLDKNEADFGTAQLDATLSAKAQTVALLYPQVFQMIVKADSDVQSPTDLEGKKVATSSASGGGYKSAFEVLSYYGVNKDQVNVVPFEVDAERDAAFVNGEVDAMFRANTIGSGSIRKLAQTTNIRFLPLDQYAGMRLQYPYLFEYTIPKGTYHAANPAIPEKDIKTVGVPTILFANSKTDATIVRLFVQALFENQSDIIQETPQGLWIESPMKYQDVVPAIHAGALAYYDRDQPSFFERNYNMVSLGATLIPLVASVYFALQSRLLTKQRDRAYKYNKQMASVLTKMMTSPTASHAKKTELQLLETLEDVINDVNQGELDLADLQAFSFVWDKALEAVRYRETALTRRKISAPQKRKGK